MVDLHELVHLDLRVLVATLPERLPLSSCLEPDEWLWLVGMLATRTVAESADLRPEDWPACSRANLYAFRSAEIAGGIDHREYVMRRLNLTAALLDRVAPDREVEILSPEGAFALLLDNLPMSLEEAFRTAPRWRELEIDQIRRLRTVKNMLTPALVWALTGFPRHRLTEFLRRTTNSSRQPPTTNRAGASEPRSRHLLLAAALDCPPASTVLLTTSDHPVHDERQLGELRERITSSWRNSMSADTLAINALHNDARISAWEPIRPMLP